MSDNWIIVIPESADFVPQEAAQQQAVVLFQRLAPTADEVKAETTSNIRFIDCGANLERVLCSICGREIDINWWRNHMDEEWETDFPLRRIDTPCCGEPQHLNELIYDWPQGFARFSVEAMNPGISDLNDEHLKAFGEILGCRVRKILQHI